MVGIPPDTFWMGCNESVDSQCDADEHDQHKVEFESAFAMAKTEVSVGQYKQCFDDQQCTMPLDIAAWCNWDKTQEADGVAPDSHPVNCVSYQMADEYCKWRYPNGRLCSESEWEMAARGGCSVHCESPGDDDCCKGAMLKYPWSFGANTGQEPTCTFAAYGDLCSLGVDLDEGTGYRTMPVGTKTAGASPYGLLDMAGNVSEWVSDCYHDSYDGAPADGSTWTACPPENSQTVMRGGSWHSSSAAIRASERSYESPGVGNTSIGIRCCLSL